MAVTRTRKVVLDKIITDLRTLTNSGGNTCFADVQKLLISFPTSYPACEVLPLRTNVEVMGMDFDSRQLSFDAIVYELIETNGSQAETDAKIDRLMDIEDTLCEYIQAIPNNLNGMSGLEALTISKTTIDNQTYNYENGENGLRLYLTVEFTVEVLNNVKTY